MQIETSVILRLHLNPPYWWLRDNPDETVIYRTPNGDKIGIDDGEPERLIHHDFAGHMRVSRLANGLTKPVQSCVTFVNC